MGATPGLELHPENMIAGRHVGENKIVSARSPDGAVIRCILHNRRAAGVAVNRRAHVYDIATGSIGLRRKANDNAAAAGAPLRETD
jgi:hypothetical protein